jgi:hypothetical protein
MGETLLAAAHVGKKPAAFECGFWRSTPVAGQKKLRLLQRGRPNRRPVQRTASR